QVGALVTEIPTANLLLLYRVQYIFPFDIPALLSLLSFLRTLPCFVSSTWSCFDEKLFVRCRNNRRGNCRPDRIQRCHTRRKTRRPHRSRQIRNPLRTRR